MGGSLPAPRNSAGHRPGGTRGAAPTLRPYKRSVSVQPIRALDLAQEGGEKAGEAAAPANLAGAAQEVALATLAAWRFKVRRGLEDPEPLQRSITRWRRVLIMAFSRSVTAILYFACACAALGALGWPVAEGEAASQATVKGDPVAVYAQMSTTSKVLKSLRRGDKVTVDLAITGPHGSWCSISVGGQAIRSGFVLCEFLEEEQPPRSQEVHTRPRAATQTAAREGGRNGEVLRQVRELNKAVRGKSGGDTPLIRAAAAGDAAAVQALLAQGADVHATNRAGETALMFAAEIGHVATVRALLYAGSAVEARNTFRETALLYAALNGHTDVVQVLAAAGANGNARDEDTLPVLALAAENGHTASVRALLAAGANVNARSDGGYTALINAAKNGHTATVQALLAAGADMNFSHVGGGASRPPTALLVATANGHDAIVRLLREAGARQ